MFTVFVFTVVQINTVSELLPNNISVRLVMLVYNSLRKLCGIREPEAINTMKNNLQENHKASHEGKSPHRGKELKS